MKILIIEDDRQIAQNLKELLVESTYTVDLAHTGEKGIDQALMENYDLIILDWMLPDLPGPEVSKSLRSAECTTPILMLTAKSQTEDLVEGLDAGADDYLTKPFNIDELLARVRALMRRPETLPDPIIKIKDITIDTNLRVVTKNNHEINLSPREFALLEYLAKYKNQSQDRLKLLSNVWGEDTNQLSNTVDVHIRYLRHKLGDVSHQLIQTIKGKGYVLCSN